MTSDFNKPSKITVRGQKVSNRTNRRYSVIAVRQTPVPADGGGMLVACAYIEKRSDSYDTALKTATKLSWTRGRGMVYVIVDTTTGEEVMAK